MDNFWKWHLPVDNSWVIQELSTGLSTGTDCPLFGHPKQLETKSEPAFYASKTRVFFVSNKCRFFGSDRSPLPPRCFLGNFFWVIHRKRSFSLLLVDNLVFVPKSYPRVILLPVFSVDNPAFSFRNNDPIFMEKCGQNSKNLLPAVDNLEEKRQIVDNFWFFGDLSPKLSTGWSA